MPKPTQRTRSRKRVFKALPGGRISVHYKREVVVKSSCGFCGRPLAGIPSLPPSEIRKLNRTKRKVSRIYGGRFCHKCLKTMLKQAARTLNIA